MSKIRLKITIILTWLKYGKKPQEGKPKALINFYLD